MVKTTFTGLCNRIAKTFTDNVICSCLENMYNLSISMMCVYDLTIVADLQAMYSTG